MYSLRAEVEFCAGHRLMKHPGKCHNLHGHNYRVVVTVHSDHVDPETGMLMDFSTLKSIMKTMIVEQFDHMTVLNAADPFVDVLESMAAPIRIMTGEPTAEAMAKLFVENLKTAFTAKISGIKVEVWETSTNAATAFLGKCA